MIPDLGKYAASVLSAYGVSIALILAIVAISVRSALRTRAALCAYEADRKREDSDEV